VPGGDGRFALTDPTVFGLEGFVYFNKITALATSEGDGAMRISGVLGVSAVAVLAGVGLARAQSAPPAELVAVPPGFTVVMVPAGAGAPMPMPMMAMPDPAALLAQADAMMAAAQQAAFAAQGAGGVVPAALRQMPAVNGNVAGVMVTTVSDGSSTCTERVVYPANGGKAQVTASGNGCDQAANLPGTTETVAPAAVAPPGVAPALQVAPKPAVAAPRLVVADNN
jgi:hypothetical protein